MNIGKVFEEQFKKSIPEYAVAYRLPDSAQSFGGGQSKDMRFTNTNPFDFFVWNPNKRELVAIEAKTVGGKSITFERTEAEGKNKKTRKEIHFHQIKGLKSWNNYDGVIGGLLIEFREIETTVFLYVTSYQRLIDSIDKKSFNFGDIENSGLPYLIVPQKKLRTRYLYDIDYLLTNIKEQKEKENNG